ncbi:MAG: ABC transporter permease [Candidatus Sumerlaeia bacterium]|nr:ABC transporter permease [Candidatus Sumerlaeia bacterium]
METLRALWLLAKGVLLEAIRRKEIYAIVLVTVILIGAVMTVDFFGLQGLEKFYREIALKVMGIATALTTIVLASRQLPREFRNRTIYPLMAKPITRTTFLLGKFFGVLLAAIFCLALFMLVYLSGALYLGQTIPWGLFFQYLYLQVILLAILATLCFWLSLLLTLDAAITLGVIFYLTASTFNTILNEVYFLADDLAKWMMVFLNYLIPNLNVFDLTEKTVHAGELWGPVDLMTMLGVSLYGIFWVGAFFGLTLLWFRRREL